MKVAAAKIASSGTLELVSHSIGFQQDYHDAYLHWEGKREIGDKSCILVRPGRFLALKVLWLSRRFDGKVAQCGCKAFGMGV